MKKVFLLAGIAALFVACSSPEASTSTSEAEEVATAESSSESYSVNVEESSVVWNGTKPSGDGHSGTVAISEGNLSVEGGIITAGNFSMDLTSLAVTDEMDDESKGKLIGHLTTGDFFEVETYPTASFEISSASADSLTGNLTIKDVTKSITIPYTMDADANTASAAFGIDRTIWGVTYNSGNFFENLGDYMIDDVVLFNISLSLTK